MKIKNSHNHGNGHASPNEVIARAKTAKQIVKAARKHLRMLKSECKQARKALKQARKASKEARKEAKAAVKLLKAKGSSAKQPRKRTVKRSVSIPTPETTQTAGSETPVAIPMPASVVTTSVSTASA